MNKRQLLALGVPEECVPAAVECVADAAKNKLLRSVNPKKAIPGVVADPAAHLADPVFGKLASALLASAAEPPPRPPIDFRQWGEDIDASSRAQMRDACRLPCAAAAALMPDAHVGYGLPIGGVLACEGAVVPYAVGVDIACRMRLTITDLPVEPLGENNAHVCRELDRALEKGTLFGAGGQWPRAPHHAVLDEDWRVTAATREMYDRACGQLGTSGSGNHFVEWGVVSLAEAQPDLGLEAGAYVALLSHSGSRGPGARVCQRYSDIARDRLPARLKNDPQLRHLAWLELDDEAGQEYWLAMNLMGRYAAANHEVIHRKVAKLAGAQALAVVENHHNFAWKETHHGRELIVHRKGATPAAPGVLGIIPGNMADPAFVVRGRGQPDSLMSASHGAGRRMSRTEAKRQFNWKMWSDYLKQRNVRLLAGGVDEAPGAYKNIHQVMAAQTDLVETLAEFHPKIVMMCGDDSPAED